MHACMHHERPGKLGWGTYLSGLGAITMCCEAGKSVVDNVISTRDTLWCGVVGRKEEVPTQGLGRPGG